MFEKFWANIIEPPARYANTTTQAKSLRVRQFPTAGNPPTGLVSPPPWTNEKVGFLTRVGGLPGGKPLRV
jgi:hypothetical protein